MKAVLRVSTNSFIVGLVWGASTLEYGFKGSGLWPPGVGGASQPGRAANGTPAARRRWGRRAAADPGHSGSTVPGSQSSVHPGGQK